METIIEPHLKYCPRCRDEYRPEIITCVACNVELITGEELLSRELSARDRRKVRELRPGEEVVAIRKGSVFDMKQLKNTLAGEGLASTLVAGEDGCGKGCCGGAEVYLSVRPADLPEVMAALEREHLRTTGLEDGQTGYAAAVFDTTAAEAVCPACGHRFATSLGVCPDCGLHLG